MCPPLGSYVTIMAYEMPLSGGIHSISSDLVQAMGGSGISKSQVSRLCEEIDERVEAFLTRPIEGE